MAVSTFDSDAYCLSKYGSDIGLNELFDKPGGLTTPDEEGNTFDINAKDERDATCLIWAARGGHASTTKMLLEKGSDIEAVGLGGMRAVHHVCNNISNEHLAVLEVLVAGSVDLNAIDEAGNAPLHYAACRGNLNIVLNLLANAADVRCRNAAGQTPLHKSSAAGHLSIMRTILEAGSDVNLQVTSNPNSNSSLKPKPKQSQTQTQTRTRT